MNDLRIGDRGEPPVRSRADREMLIGGIIDRAVRLRPHGIAGTFQGRSATFIELDGLARRWAQALSRHGARPGHPIVWIGPSGLDALALVVAAARVGVIFVPVNPRITDTELRDLLDYIEPILVVLHHDLQDLTASITTDLRSIVYQTDETRLTAMIPEPSTAAEASGVLPIGPSDTDPHIMYLTSGSTGSPKGVLVSHRASWLRSSPGGGTFTQGVQGTGGIVCSFPLHHYGGWHYVFEAWHNLVPVHLIARAYPSDILSAIVGWHASAVYCIPAVWERILEEPTGAHDLSSLRHADIGTSSVLGSLMERLRSRLPWTSTSVLYGSTEAGRMSALADGDRDRKPGSVGRPAFPGTLWVDESNEVHCSTPGLMTGYHRLPEQTAAVLRDGDYASGDVGHFDDDGFLYLSGRRREIIRTGGESVAPSEVEHALRGLPGIADVAVVGLPDARWGEIVCAVVVVTAGATVPTLQTVREHVASSLQGFKQPRRLFQLTSLPRTGPTGQLQRSLIRQTLLDDNR